jgi:hypothetical protein
MRTSMRAGISNAGMGIFSIPFPRGKAYPYSSVCDVEVDARANEFDVGLANRLTYLSMLIRELTMKRDS